MQRAEKDLSVRAALGPRTSKAGRSWAHFCSGAGEKGAAGDEGWLVRRGFSRGTGSEVAMTISDFYCAVPVPQVLLRSLRIILTPEVETIISAL